MAATNYKVFSWGKPVGTGMLGAVHVAVAGVAKQACGVLPFAVVNELICNDLAHAIRLPIPPSFLVHGPEEKPFHVSLNFHLAGEDLPPADAAAIVSDNPSLACGIIFFDAWICNGDRHNGNLAYDKATKRVMLFDHSHALLKDTGQARLERLADQPGIVDDKPHCIADAITSSDGFAEWHDRIMRVPDFYVRDAVLKTVGIGPMTPELASFCIDFLWNRRGKLPELLQANSPLFPKINKPTPGPRGDAA